MMDLETAETDKAKNPNFTSQLVLYALAFGVALAALLCVTIAALTLWQIGIFNGGTKSRSSSSNPLTGHEHIQRCNGLASNCGWRVNEVMFPGVHNAMSAQRNRFMVLMSQDALRAGFRALFIDSCDCPVFGLVLCHDVCALGHRKVTPTFTAILDFLTHNPQEVVIIELEIGQGTLAQLMETIFNIPGFSNIVYDHPGVEIEWPLMKDLIDSNEVRNFTSKNFQFPFEFFLTCSFTTILHMFQRLIIFQHDGGNCQEPGICPKGVHDTYTYAFETTYKAVGAAALLNVTDTCLITRGDHSYAFFISNHFAGNHWHFPDRQIAEMVNTAHNLQVRLDACHEIVEKRVNILVVDFWSIGDVLEVVNTNNELLGFASASPSRSPMPSMEPTDVPTGPPTIYPTLMPSMGPSDFPTGFPTINPTCLPSVAPSSTVV